LNPSVRALACPALWAKTSLTLSRYWFVLAYFSFPHLETCSLSFPYSVSLCHLIVLINVLNTRTQLKFTAVEACVEPLIHIQLEKFLIWILNIRGSSVICGAGSRIELHDFFLITSAVQMSCKYSVNVTSLHNPLHISSDRRNILTFMALSYGHQHNNNDGLSCLSLSFFFPPRWENGPRGLVFLPLLLSLEWAGFALFSAWYTVHRVM